jgi:hypothetical protein
MESETYLRLEEEEKMVDTIDSALVRMNITLAVAKIMVAMATMEGTVEIIMALDMIDVGHLLEDNTDVQHRTTFRQYPLAQEAITIIMEDLLRRVVYHPLHNRHTAQKYQPASMVASQCDRPLRAQCIKLILERMLDKI